MCQNSHESGGAHLNQVSSTGQQYYPSHSPRRNGDRGSGDHPGNDGHCLHSSGGGYGNPYGTPGGGDGGPLDDPYRNSSDNLWI